MPEANISPTTDEKPPASDLPGGDAGDAKTGPDAAATGAAQQEETLLAEEPGAAQGPDAAGDPGPADEPGAAEEPGAADAATDHDAEGPQDLEDAQDDRPRPGMTPLQARRARIVVSGVVMVAVAVALVVRLGSAPSVLTAGFYGIALILSGTAIGLSRRGRTRVAGGVLVLGFGAVALAEWLLASVQ